MEPALDLGKIVLPFLGVVVMASMASWAVTMTQALPWHFVPNSSVKVCKLSIK